ncbi:unnamed protein product [Mytilus coruscus]|uniref:Uncharacterized protein n=1 Tax=Mytilus coruscus TaxID=42192 RepID=A0A6J8CTV9_MYTCO|nr:unnamed protein product [Mytilus coruscus]
MSSRKSLSTKFSQAANKKQQSKSKVGKKTVESKKDETSCKKKATKGGSKSIDADEITETLELQDVKKKIETESIVHIQKPIEIIQTLPINTESSHEKHYDEADIKTSDHDSDFGSKDLLRPIFRIGSVESSHDGEESALGEDDQVFELKRRTSSISSQGVDGGQSYSRQSSLQEDYEDMSLSSSGFSPGSTSASLKSFEGRNRIDDFSDDSDSNKLRESAEFSDDMEVASFNFSVPYNKQLRIVTSLDPGLRLPKHDRRSSSPGGFESTGILRRRSLIFADFLSKRSLSMHLNHFPSDMTIEKFRKLTEEQLKDRFNFNHSYDRSCIMEAVRQAKKEEGDETDFSDEDGKNITYESSSETNKKDKTTDFSVFSNEIDRDVNLNKDCKQGNNIEDNHHLIFYKDVNTLDSSDYHIDKNTDVQLGESVNYNPTENQPPRHHDVIKDSPSNEQKLSEEEKHTTSDSKNKLENIILEKNHNRCVGKVGKDDTKNKDDTAKKEDVYVYE